VTALVTLCASHSISAGPAEEATTAAAQSQPASTAEPSQAAKSDANVTPAPATEAKPATKSVEAGATKSSIDKKLAEAKKQRTVMEKDGQTYYCKKEKMIGSRLPEWLCMTESQLENEIRTNQAMQDRGRLPKPCAGGIGTGTVCSGS
jgi:hypothetical protein